MAESVASQRTTYPLAAYNFRVTADDVALRVAEVSGLSREYETLTYRQGLSAWEGEAIVRYRLDTWGPLTLKKGVVAGATALYEWLASGERRTMTVSLCDHTGEPIVIWRVAQAMPVTIEAPTFDPQANDAAIETVTLMAIGITIDYD